MGFKEAVSTCLSKYATFSGRASRSEYWWFVLFVLILMIPFYLLDSMLFGVSEDGLGVFTAILSLALFLPYIAAGVRRLHDRNFTGWLYLVGLIPIVGGLILLVLLVLRGTEGANKYGPDPLA